MPACPAQQLEESSTLDAVLHMVCKFWAFAVWSFSAALFADSPIIENKKLNESSGLAFSTRSNDILFSHNDSGDGPRLYCFDRNGKTLGEIDVEGAKAIDWEDMCSFQHNGKHWLAVADTGDNEKKRKHVSLYVMEEPELKRGQLDYKTQVVCELQVSYASGSLDCEAVAYDPLSHSFLLITKQLLVCDLWQIPLPAPLRGTHQVHVESQQRLSVPYATGADITRDGKQLAICTYGPACLIQRNTSDMNKPWGNASKTSEPEFLAVPSRKQGEAVCFDPASSCVWLTSEHVPAPLIRMELPIREPIAN